MPRNDPCWWSLSELATAYQAGTLTPVQYLEHLFTRIDRLDPKLNSFISIHRPSAMAQAVKATEDLTRGQWAGPLHGIPIGIKDVIDVAGFPTTCHSRLMTTTPAHDDAPVVNSLRKAGAIILGKLATHEFAIGGPAFDLPFPPARNPWNYNHHPGGSSSGAGAAVAAALIPAAVGTDTAGSIRNPASCCGIVGVKPTYDLLSRKGVFPLAPSLDHVGPLTRSVGDARVMLEAMAGCKFARRADIAGLRVGFVRHFHTDDMHATAEVANALEQVATELENLGAIIVDIRLPPLTLYATICRILMQSEGFAIHAKNFSQNPLAFSASTRAALLPGAFVTSADIEAACHYRTRLTQAVEIAFTEVDILMTASSMEPACRIDDPLEIKRTYMLQARTVFNVTGHPALAMMAGLSADGLPLSVQFAARYRDEALLLSLAEAFEIASALQTHPPIDEIADPITRTTF